MITDIALEEDVIGGMINDKNYVYEIQKYITEDYFTDPIKQKLCNFILEQVNEGIEYNVISLTSSLNVEAFKLISWSSKCIVPSVRNAVILSDLQKKRVLFLLANKMLRECQSKESDIYETIEDTQKEINQLLDTTTSQALFDMKESCASLMEIVDTNARKVGDNTGAPYSLTELNKHTGGQHLGELTGVASESQMGKTSFVLDTMVACAMEDIPTCIFSMEMKKGTLASRVVSKFCGLSGSSILTKKLDSNGFKMLDKGIGAVAGFPIYVDERTDRTPSDICNSIRMYHRKYGIKYFYIDYVQMLKFKVNGDEKELAESARLFKNVAHSENVNVTILLQLRDGNITIPEDMIPNLKRIRGSKQIEDACDNVIIIYNPNKYPTMNLRFPSRWASVEPKNKAWIHLAKGRNVGQTDFLCDWDGSTTSFKDLGDIIDIEEANNNINIYEDCPF